METDGATTEGQTVAMDTATATTASTTPSPFSTPEKVPIFVEVCLKPTSTASLDEVKRAVERMLNKRSLSYVDGPIPYTPGEDPFIDAHVQSISICDTDRRGDDQRVLLFWQVALQIHVYQLSEDGPAEELEGDEDIATFHEWQLPARDFHGLWESLIFDTGVKQRLLRYAASALLFSDRGVDPQLVSWNRVVLLHGPPGTGKTSLCKGLAQKLSIRFRDRYPQAQLVEVNAHSLFSKWFSESGKLVTKLFQKIQELVEEEGSLVFVLIDEVESLTAARQAALSGSEPSDSIRVVNALLTQIDALKTRPNVVILTTSNITAAIDVAFVDRADIKAYIGLPSLQARYEILRSAVYELARAKIIALPEGKAEAPWGPFHGGARSQRSAARNVTGLRGPQRAGPAKAPLPGARGARRRGALHVSELHKRPAHGHKQRAGGPRGDGRADTGHVTLLVRSGRQPPF
ncbi:AAA-type ATPase [Klebsormidium nitens]|uniref:Pachytene checkpoint protein 2 homolog n=1 Tax=Klebsormidium nitens TaxID=105231 RepID=A0A1Y1HUM9_KLENI|nr:AAA-type ATPase [Klebsormidium nitens]|eukprot:GAQ79558.1 AAA-type ATPase [Klebsormidium nitens]